MSIAIKLEFAEDRVDDLLTAAFEGGSNYWCRVEYRAAPLGFGAMPTVVLEVDTKERHALDRAAIERGLVDFATKAPRHFGNWLSEHEDAETGDVFLQCCLFGEVKYG